MASDIKTPADVAQALLKTLGDKLDGLKKSADHSPAEVADALRKTYIAKIDNLKTQLEQMTKTEAAGKTALLSKNLGNLPSHTPSQSEIADGNPHKHVEPRSVFSLMKKDGWESKPPAAGKQVGDNNKASGGDVKKGKSLSKEAIKMTPPKPPSLKPAGVPAAKAGSAPKAPKTPQAPGATPAMKMELPQTPEKANGGQMSKDELAPNELDKGDGSGYAKMDLPQTPEKANGGQMSKEELASMSASKCPNCGKAGGKAAVGAEGGKVISACPACKEKSGVKKMDLPQTVDSANGGDINTAKMELPQTPEKANGGQMSKAALPMHPSPVFHVKAAGTKMAMQHDPNAHLSGATVAPPKAAALPNVEQHQVRAQGFAAHTPPGKFDKK